MTSSIAHTISATARGGPIGLADDANLHPALVPAPRSLLGGVVVIATVPLLWSWFALALRMP